MTRVSHSVANAQFGMESYKNTCGKFKAHASVIVFVRLVGLQAVRLHTPHVMRVYYGRCIYIYICNPEKTEQLGHTSLMETGTRRFFRMRDSSRDQSHRN